MTSVKLFGVWPEKFAQNPRTTLTYVEHFSTPKGQLLPAPTTRQLSTSDCCSSCSKRTSFADKDIEKGAHGPQENTADGGSSEVFLNAAKSRLLTHFKRESTNVDVVPLCNDTRALPVALKSRSEIGICCTKLVFDKRKEGPSCRHDEGADASFVTHRTASATEDDVMEACDMLMKDRAALDARTSSPADVSLVS